MQEPHRIAFVLKLLPGDHEAEYERRHSPVWPELEEVFRQHGVLNYSIFLHRDTLQLFGYAEVESVEQWESIAETGACRKWWDYMSDIMEYHEDGTPKAVKLREVFHFKP